MNKICTSLEQSKKLIELGIDITTADMYWWYSGKRYYVESMDDDDFNKESDIPAWSFSALFKMLPYSARIEKGSSLELYCVTLPNKLRSSDWYAEPIDAVFEMVCTLYKI